MYQIVWSVVSRTTYFEILEQLHDDWPIDVLINFDEKVQDLLLYLSTHKHLCPIIEKNVRKCVINKHK